MLQVKDIADNLGLSKPQARRRIKSIQDILEETDRKGVKRGKHNKLLVSQDAFSMLRKLEEYRNNGNTTQEAKDRIREDLDLQSVRVKPLDPLILRKITPLKGLVLALVLAVVLTPPAH